MTGIGQPHGEPPSASASEQFRLLVQRSPDMVSIYDPEGRYGFVNHAHTVVLGYAPEELIGRVPLEFIHPDDLDSVATEFAGQFAGDRPSGPVEFRFRGRDGRYRYVEAVAVDLSAEPAVGGLLVSSRDVSDRRRAELLVQEQAAILERIARGAPLGQTLDALCEMVERWVPGAVAVVLLVRSARLRVSAAPSASAALHDVLHGAPPPSNVDARLRDGVIVAPIASDPPNPAADAVFRDHGLTAWWGAPVFASDGREILGSLALLLPELRDPEPIEEQLVAAAGSLAAIAVERARVQERLAHQASHDALTGLPNREHLVDRLRSIAGVPDSGHAAVFFLDLDRFKVFNDSAGHDAGDRILVDVARRLRSALRDGDAVARFGGDEFVVVCTGLGDLDEVHVVARRLLDVIARPFEVDGMELVVSASVGVALVDGRPPEALLRDADAAMYHAKDRGRARVELFDDALRARVVARLETERELRRALDAGEVTVHYQPVIALEHGTLAGFEALVRWHHPTRGVVGPGEFLDVAEETGLIARIGALTRRLALAQWAAWRAAHPGWGDFIMGINVSAAEVRDASLPDQVATLVRETGVDPRFVVLEVSERVLAADTEAARDVLEALRHLGVLLALDDFGTGSSPLLHLRRFPIDAVKLDGRLVAGLGESRDDKIIVASVIELAHRLGRFVVAEGVERPDQVEYLRANGCLLAQGHVFAPALPAEDAARWAAAHVRAATMGGATR